MRVQRRRRDYIGLLETRLNQGGHTTMKFPTLLYVETQWEMITTYRSGRSDGRVLTIRAWENNVDD
jgi:hypothetical protein